ncbi:MAG: hypothetical protein PF904_13210 [Kiritimatiellae bacterium]|jgi:tetratricopeptide (TPR) repeat protein|nr:hypothetical protein [Kiritimatiellia bacterium]
MMKIKSNIASFLVLMSLMASATQISQTQWQKYADNLKNEPGLIRFYSFKSADKEQPNLGTSGVNMKFAGSKTASMKTEPGRIEGLLAPVLDAESFRAPTIVESNNAVSVSLWVKPIGAGVKQNGGSENGMIASSGSGYYDGWRIAIYDMEKLIPSFEIGRGKNSIRLISKESLCRASWNHIAATWDGSLMKIYVNGIFAGSTAFSGPYQAAKSSLCVGFCGFGVGSMNMELDEIAVFNGSLSPAKVMEISLTWIGYSEEIKTAVNRSHDFVLNDKPGLASEELKKLLSDNILDPELISWLKVAALQIAVNEKSPNEWINQCIELWERPSMPAHLKGKLLACILDCCRNESVFLPSRILEVLPSAVNLSEEDKFICAGALARSYALENQEEKSHKVFEYLIGLSADDLVKLAGLRFQFAQSLRSMGKNAEACEQYNHLINNNKMPVSVRSIAVLSLAKTLQSEKKYDEAIQAYNSIQSIEDFYLHHKFEAEAGRKICENLKAGKEPRDPEEFRDRLASLPQPAITLFVSPKGSDENPGTFKKHLYSISK